MFPKGKAIGEAVISALVGTGLVKTNESIWFHVFPNKGSNLRGYVISALVASVSPPKCLSSAVQSFLSN